MITLLTGDNSYEIEQFITRTIAESPSYAERIDGSALELRDLPNLLMGATLFSSNRLVIIKNLAENKTVWPIFSDWIERISSETSLILIEAKPDKRTITYRDLKKMATVIEYKQWGDRDISLAEKWTIAQALSMGMTLNTKLVQLIVRRVGVDQWNLYHALEKLSLLDDVSEAVIIDVIDSTPSENVFNLFEAALKGDRGTIVRMIRTLELTEDPYRLFGLLSGQAFQLAALVVSDTSSGEVARDIGAHPYALGKLAPYAKKMGRSGARKLINAFASADDDLKISRAEPWLVIEQSLSRTSQIL
jgi:DNA polymerase III delta subunit